MNQTKFFISIGLVAVLAGCASSLNTKIEETQFLLDKGKFSEAITKAREAVAEDPTSVEARFLLASALLGDSVITNSGQCSGDSGYLGLVACLQDDQGSGESNIETFTRIAPTTTEKLAELDESRGILVTLSEESGVSNNVFLQLYIARLFEISAALTRIGMTSDDLICNADPDNAMKDGVPDDYDPTALTAGESERFQNNLSSANGNGSSAGFPSTFGLNARISAISSDLNTAISSAGDDAKTGTENYFKAQFGDPSAAVCNVAK